MSEESRKVEGIDQIAIFPLPLVLMPFEILPLHIFEPRYREMLKDAQAGNNLFGISFFEPGTSFLDRPEPGSIGCVTEIRESQTMEDGRSNVLTIGLIRYRINEYIETEKPYLIANVEFFEDDPPEEELPEQADKAFSLFKQLAMATHRISGHFGELPDIPKAEPEQLSFLICAAFNLDIQKKSQILEMRSTVERLKTINEILAKAVFDVENTEKINKISRTNGHSKKKIDTDGI
ncbi:MAG: LON peptidase substrate-binding domain-containing protein [Acidobacteria bacterium]|nr:LON peptidase substrate-binding domain-containing protein [Acidobacteriota bacterium]